VRNQCFLWNLWDVPNGNLTFVSVCSHSQHQQKTDAIIRMHSRLFKQHLIFVLFQWSSVFVSVMGVLAVSPDRRLKKNILCGKIQTKLYFHKTTIHISHVFLACRHLSFWFDNIHQAICTFVLLTIWISNVIVI